MCFIEDYFQVYGLIQRIANSVTLVSQKREIYIPRVLSHRLIPLKSSHPLEPPNWVHPARTSRTDSNFPRLKRSQNPLLISASSQSLIPVDTADTGMKGPSSFSSALDLP